jgi:biopolymer transport protein ExbD
MKDSANYEFRYWIRNARKYNPDAEVAIKGDAGTDYKVIKKIMDILQENNVNKFNLITNLQKQEVKLSDIPANPTK